MYSQCLNVSNKNKIIHNSYFVYESIRFDFLAIMILSVYREVKYYVMLFFFICKTIEPNTTPQTKHYFFCTDLKNKEIRLQ